MQIKTVINLKNITFKTSSKINKKIKKTQKQTYEIIYH